MNIILVFLTLVSSLAGMVLGQTCPSGWYVAPDNPKKCFYYSKNYEMPPKASEACKELGGNLASIESEAQNTMVKNLVRSMDPRHPTLLITLGGYREDGWKWFWKWEDGQPWKFNKLRMGAENGYPNYKRLYLSMTQEGWKAFIGNAGPYICSKFLTEAEPEPTSKPEPEPEPTSKPEPEPEPTSKPEPEPKEDSCPANGGNCCNNSCRCNRCNSCRCF